MRLRAGDRIVGIDRLGGLSPPLRALRASLFETGVTLLFIDTTGVEDHAFLEWLRDTATKRDPAGYTGTDGLLSADPDGIASIPIDPTSRLSRD